MIGKLGRSDRGVLLLLTLAAGWLYLGACGALPLRDWDEGTIAQVAVEMWRSGSWLHPTLYGAPYLNKPPLVEWLITLGYAIGGVNAGMARLFPALVSALAVPWIYLVGRQFWPDRRAALASAAVYLTLMPAVRHGRLAMRDGVAVTLFMVLLWAVLQTRRDRRWGLLVGFALSGLALTKGILALLLGGLVGLWLVVSRSDSVWRSPIAGLGLGLGLVPAIAWYGAQLLHYGEFFWQGHVLAQSFDRVWTAVDHHQAPPWFYLVELAESTWPWLLFWPGSLGLAWRSRSQLWAQWVLIGTVGYLGAISVMTTKLPWYIQPLYPLMALTLGPYLSQLWVRARDYWRGWAWGLGLIALAAAVGGPVWGVLSQQWLLLPLGAGLGLSLGLAALWIGQGDRRFLPAIAIGMYGALSLFVWSPFWLWELNEDYPVRPVAALVQTQVPPASPIWTTVSHHRPSLDFYAGHHIPAIAIDQMTTVWTPPAYFLVDAEQLPTLTLPPYTRLGTAEGITLISAIAP